MIAMAKKEKAPNEKKSKVKKVGDKPPKGKKDKAAAAAVAAAAGEEAAPGGKKKLIIVAVLALMILAGGGGAAYFLVYLPMVEEAAAAEALVEPEIILPPAEPSGYYGYLSHSNSLSSSQLLLQSVDVIKAGETRLIEQMSLTEEQMEKGYYISTPQAGNRVTYVDQATLYTIISRETGEYQEVSLNDFLTHLGSSTILFELEFNSNTLLSVKEFPVDNFVSDIVPEVVPVPDEDNPDAPEVVNPDAPEVVNPDASEVVNPDAPEVVNPDAPEVVEPLPANPEGETPPSAQT